MVPSKVVLKSAGNVSGNKLTVDFINCWQGNSVLITYPNGAYMLVDCGSQTTSQTSWPYTHVASYIASVVGTNSIDCVVMSHGDDDHTAFIPHIPQAAAPTYLHYGGSIGDYDTDVQTYIKGRERAKAMVFRYPAKGYSNTDADADFASETTAGEAWVIVLSANFGKSPNSRSIVLLIRYGDHAVVLPGDASSDTEDHIIAKVPKKMLTNATVLMPGHHGAYESTSDAWVKALKPGISVISASGANMAYAHPACMTNEILKVPAATGEDHTITCSDGKGKKYKKSDTTKAVLVTATQGDVRFVSDGKNFRLLASSLKTTLAAPPPAPQLAGLVRNATWNRPLAPPTEPEPVEVPGLEFMLT